MLVSQEFAECVSLAIECSPHLEAAARGVRADFGATASGVRAYGGNASVDVFFACVGLNETDVHLEISSSVADGEQHRGLAALRDLRSREPVFLQQELESGGCLGHEGLAANVHSSKMPSGCGRLPRESLTSCPRTSGWQGVHGHSPSGGARPAVRPRPGGGLTVEVRFTEKTPRMD